MNNTSALPFKNVLGILRDEGKALEENLYHRLSSLSAPDQIELENAWDEIPVSRREELLTRAKLHAKDNLLLSYLALGKIAVEDTNPQIRVLALQLLFDEEEVSLAHLYLNRLEFDDDTEVRATAASGLGNFVYLGELEEIPRTLYKSIESQLMTLTRSSEAPAIRRRALESLGFSSHGDMLPIIEEAFSSDEDEWVTSALFAMGRSANKRWSKDVATMLDHDSPMVRLEAIRAAGELEMQDNTELILEALNDPSLEVRDAAIWTLSQIGGETAQAALTTLFEIAEEQEDNELAVYLDEAMENLSFTDDINRTMSLLEFDDDAYLDELGL
jgi:HEAT repeat protein